MRTMRTMLMMGDSSDDLEHGKDGENDDGNTEAAVNEAAKNRANYGSIIRAGHESITYIGNGRVEIIEKRHMISAVRCPCSNQCGKWVRVGTYAEHADETCSWECVHCGAVRKPSWAYSALRKHVIYQTSCLIKQGMNTKHENQRQCLGEDMLFKVDAKRYVVKENGFKNIQMSVCFLQINATLLKPFFSSCDATRCASSSLQAKWWQRFCQFRRYFEYYSAVSSLR